MKIVVLKENYRGLKAGTEFTYDEKLDAWVFEVEEDNIGDHYITSVRSKIQFSNEFVINNPTVFVYPANKRDEKLDQLYVELDRIQDEIVNLINKEDIDGQ